MPKIYWTPAEKIKVIHRAIELRRQRVWPSPVALLREATKVLPPRRQRRFRTIKQVPWFVAALESRSTDAEKITLLREMLDTLARIEKILGNSEPRL